MKNENHHEFKLIDSIFTPEEASSVLTTLINSKINYHRLDDFSNHIRFDRDLTHSQKRIKELEAALTSLKQFTTKAKESGSNMVVKGLVTLAIEP